MKIISGSKKSYIISAPKNLPVRPTSGLVKESLFNILNNYFNFNNIKVLDLYAGTGNISYEFGSRGCQEIDSIDINSRCTSFIKKKSLELNFKINVVTSSADKFIKKSKSKYNIIFADPPYQRYDIEKLIESVLGHLNKKGKFILECDKKQEPILEAGFRDYGQTRILFWENA